MAFRLQIFKANGALAFDTSQGHRLSRLHAHIGYSITPGGTVNLSVPGVALDGTWAVVPVPTGGFNLVEITFSANTVTLHCPGWAGGHSSSILVYRL